MIKYKNISSYPLNFYGVSFNPNDEKEVPGFINHPKMVRIINKVEEKPKAIIEVVKEEPKIEEKPIEEKPKRRNGRKNKNKNQ